jgi:hypothetical protein
MRWLKDAENDLQEPKTEEMKTEPKNRQQWELL